MDKVKVLKIKGDIISLGRMLWDRDLVGGWNGNISVRLDDSLVLLTGRGTCLGFLKEDDIVLTDLDGRVIGGGEPTSERLLHLDVYKRFPAVRAVVHTHTVFTNAFFLDQDVFRPSTFEGGYVLGEVFGVDQVAINVQDTDPVLRRLGENKIVVLRRHGVVSVGQELFECFARIQVLEEQAKMEAMRALFAASKRVFEGVNGK